MKVETGREEKITFLATVRQPRPPAAAMNVADEADWYRAFLCCFLCCLESFDFFVRVIFAETGMGTGRTGVAASAALAATKAA